MHVKVSGLPAVSRSDPPSEILDPSVSEDRIKKK